MKTGRFLKFAFCILFVLIIAGCTNTSNLEKQTYDTFSLYGFNDLLLNNMKPLGKEFIGNGTDVATLEVIEPENCVEFRTYYINHVMDLLREKSDSGDVYYKYNAEKEILPDDFYFDEYENGSDGITFYLKTSGKTYEINIIEQGGVNNMVQYFKVTIVDYKVRYNLK